MSDTKQLVLLPGTLCDEHLWAHQVKHLADVAEVHFGDLSKSSSVTDVARDVLQNAPGEFALAGHSMGAIIAFETVRQAPERVTKLAILSGNARGSTPANFEAWDTWEEMTRSGRFEEVLDALTGWTHQDSPLLHSVIKLMGQRVGEAAFLKQLDTLRSREDRRELLPEIACPTLLVVGRSDPATPAELHEEIKERMPQAALVVVEECGHYSMLEQPVTVTAALRAWLVN